MQQRLNIVTGNVALRKIILSRMRIDMIFLRAFFLLWLGLQGFVWGETLSPETVKRHAGVLLFSLGSKDTTVSKQQLEELLSKEGEAIGMLYQRVYDNRLKKQKDREYLSKKIIVDEKDYYLFNTFELRSAALELLFELGDGALEVLLESIHSSKQEIVLGVVKALDRFDDTRVVLLLSDILELDKWGMSKFSVLVRRQATLNLRRYLDEEMAQMLLSKAIKDADIKVRSNAQVVLGGAKNKEFAMKLFLEAYEFELNKFTKELAAAKERGVGQKYSDDVLSLASMSVLLENMAKYLPETYSKVHIPTELLGKRAVLRTFLRYHSVLPVNIRTEVIDIVFDHSNDGILLLDALKALKKKDGSRYLSKLRPCLDLKKDPAVVHLALKWCGEWGVEAYVKEIKMISEKARQKEIRNLALQYLETL